MNYQNQIEDIIKKALIEKTFNLEIIDEIKKLKDGFTDSQEEIERLETRGEQLEEELQEVRKVREQLKTDLDIYKERDKDIREKEKAQDKLQYELEFQKNRSNEIKELFGWVVKGPMVARNKTYQVPVPQNGGGAYMTTVSENETVETR